MEVCKNKDSGKYFIFLEDIGLEKILLVTPEANVKPLKSNLFDEVEDLSEEYLIENSFVSEDQVRVYREFQKNRSDDFIENSIIDFENMAPHQQREFIRQLQEKLQNMMERQKEVCDAKPLLSG